MAVEEVDKDVDIARDISEKRVSISDSGDVKIEAFFEREDSSFMRWSMARFRYALG